MTTWGVTTKAADDVWGCFVGCHCSTCLITAVARQTLCAPLCDMKRRHHYGRVQSVGTAAIRKVQKRRGCACELWCSELVIYVCMHALFCDGSHIDQFFFFYWKINMFCSCGGEKQTRSCSSISQAKFSAVFDVIPKRKSFIHGQCECAVWCSAKE